MCAISQQAVSAASIKKSGRSGEKLSTENYTVVYGIAKKLNIIFCKARKAADVASRTPL